MTDEAIRDAIFKCLRRVAPEANPATLSPAENFRQALDIDSYDFLQFLIALSEDLGVEVPESEYGKVGTLESMREYLRTRIAR